MLGFRLDLTGTARGYADWVTGELVFHEAGFGPAAVPYLRGWELQRHTHARRVAGEIPDTCLLLEHEPVYTAGKRTEPADRPLGDPGAPVIEVDRGGKITWHGPGQLVGYPIVKLAEPIDVIAYVRAIEQALIRICAEFGVPAERVKGRSGAWVRGGTVSASTVSASTVSAGTVSAGTGPAPAPPDRKVAAIGARVSRGVTMHGFALNCDCDLSWFGKIIPCGLSDVGTTSLSAETGRHITVADVLPVAEQAVADALGASAWRRDVAMVTTAVAG
jgi:lipoyl(octanoyl) transferase